MQHRCQQYQRKLILLIDVYVKRKKKKNLTHQLYVPIQFPQKRSQKNLETLRKVLQVEDWRASYFCFLKHQRLLSVSKVIIWNCTMRSNTLTLLACWKWINLMLLLQCAQYWEEVRLSQHDLTMNSLYNTIHTDRYQFIQS